MGQGQKRGKRLKRFDSALALSLAACFMLTIFAPMEIYLNNPEEFWYNAWFLLPWCLLLFAMALAGCLLVFALSRAAGERIYNLALAVGFVIFAGCYVEGNYLVSALPALDGTEIDFSLYTGATVKSAVVWTVVFIVTAALLAVLKAERFQNFVKWASTFLTSILLITLSVLFIGNGGHEWKEYLTSVKDNQFEMSTDANFVVLVLDAVDAGRTEEVWKAHPEYEEAFADFTYYGNTMAGYPYTECAIPLMFSGEWYENEQPYEDYVQHVFGESVFFDSLERQGYELNLYDSKLQLDEGVIGDRYESLVQMDLKLLDPGLFIKRQLKMVGFKYAPWVLKPYCRFDAHKLWNQRIMSTDNELFLWEDSAFYEDVQEDAVTYTDVRQFKMIHLEGAHAPFVYNGDVQEIGASDYDSCIEACMTLTIAYLNKLRDAGVYDNSIILVMSDHGLGDNPDTEEGRQHPILFVKGLQERHEFQVSQAPISHGDLVSAYDRLLKGEFSDHIFDWSEGDERERRYLLYNIVRRKHIEEYIQTGHASGEETLKATGRIYEYK